MTFFDQEELVDCLRHNFALQDETGLTARIIAPPTKRAPAEGLPLKLVKKGRKQRECDEELQSHIPSLRHLLLQHCEQSRVLTANPRPLDRVRSKLMARLAELEEGGTTSSKTGIKSMQEPAGQIHFCTKDLTKQMTTSNNNVDSEISMTTRLLAEVTVENDSASYTEYAKFEAMVCAPNSKRFCIVFPFANRVIPIHIIQTASVAELIGLSCNVYNRQRLEPPCDSPSKYDLYLAEEDTLEYDIELPPLDRRRRVADCGFPALAMIARNGGTEGRRTSQPVIQFQVNIYVTDGRCYVMQLNSLDIPLKEVFDYAIERNKGDNDQIPRHLQTAYFRGPGYVLEPLDRPGYSLDLASSVSSTGTTNFVFLRKNSSRGKNLIIPNALSTFITAGGNKSTKSLDHSQSMVNFNTEKVGSNSMVESEFNKRLNRFSGEHHQQMLIDSLATLSRASGAQLAHQFQMTRGGVEDIGEVGGNILEQYEVNRIHRFHPKTLSRLVIREQCLELVDQCDENRSDPKKINKLKRIPWQLIGAVEVPPHSSEQRSNARRTVRIIWLDGASASLCQKLAERAEHSSTAYEYCFWKTMIIEATGHEAWNIGVRV